jgi:AraC-like DNA-binding protein
MAPRSDTRPRREALLRDVMAIIENEYDRPLELHEVAQRVAASRRQIQRVLEEIHGESFRTTLTNIRLDRAARLLEQPLTVRHVAALVGYSQPAQFAKAFRRRHGVSPSQYRERLLSAARARL